MSLASHLLKHLIITKTCGTTWQESSVSKDDHGKPCYISTNSKHVVDFNVSHQAGLVSLIASVGFKNQSGEGVRVEVGTDVVCANERIKQDHAHIDKSGFFDWVDMHGDVFAESELSHMKLSPVPIVINTQEMKIFGYGNDALSRIQRRTGTTNISYSDDDGEKKELDLRNEEVVDKKLRRFYAHWCLREAYVKMTGEALLASWLKDLEITEVQAPDAIELAGPGLTDVNHVEKGAVKTDFSIIFKERKVNDVKIELTAFGSHYMVGAAIRIPRGFEQQIASGQWEWLDLERDVLEVAEAAI